MSEKKTYGTKATFNSLVPEVAWKIGPQPYGETLFCNPGFDQPPTSLWNLDPAG